MVDIMEREMLPPSHADHMKMLSIRKDCAASIINSGLKADENRFRRKQNDVLQRLFDVVKKDKKLPAPVTIEG